MGTISFDCFEFLLWQAHCAPFGRCPGLSYAVASQVGRTVEYMYADLEKMMPFYHQVELHQYRVRQFRGQSAMSNSEPACGLPIDGQKRYDKNDGLKNVKNVIIVQIVIIVKNILSVSVVVRVSVVSGDV